MVVRPAGFAKRDAEDIKREDVLRRTADEAAWGKVVARLQLGRDRAAGNEHDGKGNNNHNNNPCVMTVYETAEHSDCLHVRTAQSRSTQPLKPNGGECSTDLV